MPKALPKVKLTLVGVNGNAFSVIGAFQQAAKKAGWPKDQIREVLDDAMSSDYDHLLATILNHCCEDEDEDHGEE